jgi:hypothetical protein
LRERQLRERHKRILHGDAEQWLFVCRLVGSLQRDGTVLIYALGKQHGDRHVQSDRNQLPPDCVEYGNGQRDVVGNRLRQRQLPEWHERIVHGYANRWLDLRGLVGRHMLGDHRPLHLHLIRQRHRDGDIHRVGNELQPHRIESWKRQRDYLGNEL